MTAASLSYGYGRLTHPDFGLCLDDLWDPPWPYRQLDWPDLGCQRRWRWSRALSRTFSAALVTGGVWRSAASVATAGPARPSVVWRS